MNYSNVTIDDNGYRLFNTQDWRDINSISKNLILKWEQEEQEAIKNVLELARIQMSQKLAWNSTQSIFEEKGLCKYDGSKLRFWGRKCKSCGRKNK